MPHNLCTQVNIATVAKKGAPEKFEGYLEKDSYSQIFIENKVIIGPYLINFN